ncbi:MAG: LysR family transcriptional regulator, partial [Clostridia bacterium]|nr:LysR family transcriptional regulator [Clostridia bacterium]
MNILHMKYATEVAKAGSLNKASETLLVAVPNLSRSIKELEADIGILIFDRTYKGMCLTPEGEEFIGFAQGILSQIESVEKYYKDGTPSKQKFSISVPRACYISEAFANFSKTLTKDASEIFYKETNSQRTIHNMINHDYKLGIIRYAENYDKYFRAMLDEKEFLYELVTEFTYSLIMSADNPLAKKDEILFEDLTDYIEIAHADPFVPSMPMTKVVK